MPNTATIERDAAPLRPMHCRGCGRQVGFAPQQTVTSGGKKYIREQVAFCPDPSCLYLPPGAEQDARDSVITQLFADGSDCSTIAAMFGLSRQRVFQIRAGR